MWKVQLKAIGIFILAHLTILPWQAQSEDLYTVSSKDIEWLQHESTISEIKRDDRTSLLHITNINQLVALDGKFVFCYVFRLAQQRGFRYAKWSKSVADDREILVVFLKSEMEELHAILGEQADVYEFYDHPLDTEAREWKKLQKGCGF